MIFYQKADEWSACLKQLPEGPLDSSDDSILLGLIIEKKICF